MPTLDEIMNRRFGQAKGNGDGPPGVQARSIGNFEPSAPMVPFGEVNEELMRRGEPAVPLLGPPSVAARGGGQPSTASSRGNGLLPFTDDIGWLNPSELGQYESVENPGTRLGILEFNRSRGIAQPLNPIDTTSGGRVFPDAGTVHGSTYGLTSPEIVQGGNTPSSGTPSVQDQYLSAVEQIRNSPSGWNLSPEQIHRQAQSVIGQQIQQNQIDAASQQARWVSGPDAQNHNAFMTSVAAYRAQGKSEQEAYALTREAWSQRNTPIPLSQGGPGISQPGTNTGARNSSQTLGQNLPPGNGDANYPANDNNVRRGPSSNILRMDAMQTALQRAATAARAGGPTAPLNLGNFLSNIASNSEANLLGSREGVAEVIRYANTNFPSEFRAFMNGVTPREGSPEHMSEEVPRRLLHSALQRYLPIPQGSSGMSPSLGMDATSLLTSLVPFTSNAGGGMIDIPGTNRQVPNPAPMFMRNLYRMWNGETPINAQGSATHQAIFGQGAGMQRSPMDMNAILRMLENGNQTPIGNR